MRLFLLLGFFLMQFARVAFNMPITNPIDSVANIADPLVLNVRIANAGSKRMSDASSKKIGLDCHSTPWRDCGWKESFGVYKT